MVIKKEQNYSFLMKIYPYVPVLIKEFYLESVHELILSFNEFNQKTNKENSSKNNSIKIWANNPFN